MFKVHTQYNLNDVELTPNHVKEYTLSIIKQMNQDIWTPDVVLGFTRGGLVPANFISQW